ncbi:hypothetical protein AB0P32_33710 [Streptomyces sp. NPDC085995]|uniref:hypothetical protein n=2 Tax=Streptomyces TaxID=1883 RepID=UPI0034246DA0
MSIEDEARKILLKMGLWWPEADSGNLRDAATAWRTFADAVDDVRVPVHRSASWPARGHRFHLLEVPRIHTMTDHPSSRLLSPLELKIFGKLLGSEFPGAAELRNQLPKARVKGHWGADSPSIDVEVPDSVPAAPIGDGVLPAAGTVVDSSGDLFGELLIWVSDGRLSALEFTWYGDTPPTELPDPGSVTVQTTG